MLSVGGAEVLLVKELGTVMTGSEASSAGCWSMAAALCLALLACDDSVGRWLPLLGALLCGGENTSMVAVMAGESSYPVAASDTQCCISLLCGSGICCMQGRDAAPSESSLGVALLLQGKRVRLQLEVKYMCSKHRSRNQDVSATL